MGRFFVLLFNNKCVAFINQVNFITRSWNNRLRRKDMQMMFLNKFFEKERNNLIKFFEKKKGKIADKVKEKAEDIRND